MFDKANLNQTKMKILITILVFGLLLSGHAIAGTCPATDGSNPDHQAVTENKQIRLTKGIHFEGDLITARAIEYLNEDNNKTEVPIPDVEITISHKFEKIKLTTDGNGQITFMPHNSGLYTLSATGFEYAAFNVEASAGRVTYFGPGDLKEEDGKKDGSGATDNETLAEEDRENTTTEPDQENPSADQPDKGKDALSDTSPRLSTPTSNVIMALFSFIL